MHAINFKDNIMNVEHKYLKWFNVIGRKADLSKGLLLCALFALPVSAESIPLPAMNGNSNNVMQQQKMKAQGVVVDSSGEPLIGVNIMIKGSSSGTITDIDGRFSLDVSPSAVLVYSYIGYKTVEMKVTKNDMRIILKNDATLLDEVVVVAYGAQKKVTVTGAVASVKSDVLLKSPSTNVEATLAGRIPGLTALQGGGEPGRDDVTFYLRGIGTTNGKSPLILVDGVPRDNMRAINANEIESLSVLKDASATAVFGVRGANGVILITTKRGKKGEVNVNASLEYSFQQFAFKPETLDSWDYAVLRNETRQNEGLLPEFSDEDIEMFESWKTGNPRDPYWHPNHHWFDILFKDYAPQTKANLNITGGSEKTQYFISAGYVHQGGMFNVEPKSRLGYNAQSEMDRYNFRSNLDYKLNNVIKVSLDASSYIEKVNGTQTGLDTVFPWTLALRPTQPGILTTSDYPLSHRGEFSNVPVGGVVVDPVDKQAPSPYAMINRTGYKQETRSGLNAIVNVNFDLGFITPGLSTKGLFSFESKAVSYMNASKDYVKYTTEVLPDGTKAFIIANDREEDGALQLSRSQISNYYLNMQWHVNYGRTFAEKHDIGGLLLFQRDLREVDENSGYSDKYLPFNVLGFSGRFTYAYDSRYLLEANIGYNGSEQFSPNKRFGFFPAFSAGWVVSNESFLKDNKWLTNLKLRASYGKVGNDQIGARRFLYLDNIAVGGTDSNALVRPIPSLGTAGNKKINFNYIGNPDVTWEVAKKQNYGVDLTLFKDLSLTFDYFIEHREQILIGRNTVPQVQGLSSGSLPMVNMGKVDNRGYEFALSYNKVFNKDYALGLNLNYSYSKNKVTEFDEVTLGEDYACRTRSTGYSIGQQWGYKIDRSVDAATGRDGSGFFNSDADIKNSGLTYEIGTPKPGDFIYVDANHDGKINEKDMMPIGYSNAAPRQIYGASLSLKIKNFDISCLFQGVGQYSRYYAGWGIFEEYGTNGYFKDHLGRWSEERYEAKLNGENVDISHPRLAISSTSHTTNDYYIMNASFLRLKNAEIGYTLPGSISKFIGAQTLRFYANGSNLFTWHHLKTDSYDPEQNSLGAYPTLRTFNLGVNVVF